LFILYFFRIAASGKRQAERFEGIPLGVEVETAYVGAHASA